MHIHTRAVKERKCVSFSQAMGDGGPYLSVYLGTDSGERTLPSLSSPGLPSPRAGKKEARITFVSCDGVAGREAGGQVATGSVCASMCVPRSLGGWAWQGLAQKEHITGGLC